MNKEGQIINWGNKQYLNHQKTAQVVTMAMIGNMVEVMMVEFMGTADYKQNMKKHTDRVYSVVMKPNQVVLRYFPTRKAFSQGSSEIMKRFHLEYPKITPAQELLCYLRAYLSYFHKIHCDSQQYFEKGIPVVINYEKMITRLVKREYSIHVLMDHLNHLYYELHGKLAHLFDENGEIYPPEKLKTLITPEHYEQLESQRPGRQKRH